MGPVAGDFFYYTKSKKSSFQNVTLLKIILKIGI